MPRHVALSWRGRSSRRKFFKSPPANSSSTMYLRQLKINWFLNKIKKKVHCSENLPWMSLERHTDELHDVVVIEFTHYQSLHHKISLRLWRCERRHCLDCHETLLVSPRSVSTLENLAKGTLTEGPAIIASNIHIFYLLNFFFSRKWRSRSHYLTSVIFSRGICGRSLKLYNFPANS